MRPTGISTGVNEGKSHIGFSIFINISSDPAGITEQAFCPTHLGQTNGKACARRFPDHLFARHVQRRVVNVPFMVIAPHSWSEFFMLVVTSRRKLVMRVHVLNDSLILRLKTESWALWNRVD